LEDLSLYRDLLRQLIGRGYASSFFTEGVAPFRRMLIRHDVDLCLEKACEVAMCEFKEGIRATYFILLDTQFYNAFSSRGREILNKIRICGHEIGLHFDASLIGNYELLQQRVHQECCLLKTLTGRKVRVVAPHRPDPSFLGNPNRIGGRLHPYMPQFFNDIHYASDSMGGWTRDHPIDCEAFQSRRSMQILTHPYIWTMPHARCQTDRIRDMLNWKARALDLAARQNFKTYIPDAVPSVVVHLAEKART
jgi:hypothetical protein